MLFLNPGIVFACSGCRALHRQNHQMCSRWKKFATKWYTELCI